MTKRQSYFERFNAVGREHETAKFAVELLMGLLRTNPSFLRRFELGQRDAIRLRDNLESTFLIRIFAEFEAGLRDAWQDAFHRQTQPAMKDLLEAVTGLRLIPRRWSQSVDEVRKFRNSMVHPGQVTPQVFSLIQARERICQFWSFMPLDW